MSELNVDERTAAIVHALERFAELVERGPTEVALRPSIFSAMAREYLADLARPGVPHWWEPAP